MPASVTHVTVGTSPFTDLGRDTGEIAVLNSSDTATVYVKLGAAGTVKGANCYRIPPGSRRKIKVTTDGNTVVHHISTAATTDVENRGGLMTSELERLGPGPGSPGGGAVDSVDGQTGAVDLTNSLPAAASGQLPFVVTNIGPNLLTHTGTVSGEVNPTVRSGHPERLPATARSCTSHKD
ncbi:MAG TPA: hypothetical protein VFP81_04130 [Propionibacteriaceae bacterium]|jgi:hypothetical protein|nr:hypothetical protein [Propionibacteriaceae bacterium]